MSPTICPQCGGTNTSPATLPLLYCRDCQIEFGGDHRERLLTGSRLAGANASAQRPSETERPRRQTPGPFLHCPPAASGICLAASASACKR